MVYNILQIILLGHNCHILTYTIEDYDGGVDRVTYDGQQTRDKGIADGNSCLQVGEDNNYHTSWSRQAILLTPKADITETEADMVPSMQNATATARSTVSELHLVTDGGADGLPK